MVIIDKRCDFKKDDPEVIGSTQLTWVSLRARVISRNMLLSVAPLLDHMYVLRCFEHASYIWRHLLYSNWWPVWSLWLTIEPMGTSMTSVGINHLKSLHWPCLSWYQWHCLKHKHATSCCDSRPSQSSSSGWHTVTEPRNTANLGNCRNNEINCVVKVHS